MLEVRGIEASYGASQVLFGMDLTVGAGEVATLLGRNGMGKTTTVRAIMGMLQPHGGRIMFDGVGIHGLPSHKVAQAGIGLVPEGRQIFPNLSVRENLVATARPRRGASRDMGAESWTFDKVIDLFPGLSPRLESAGNQLSGGEQQMLAVGRALMTNPQLLILDEATEGLAPLVRTEIWSCLADLKTARQSILVIDKNVAALTKIADRHHIVEKGRVVWTGTSDELRADGELQARYLGV
ncbi:MAG: ABC transporter ATP-binding protein [Proteobacteria bacterium]|nr:ABC transporter ATP-binding protein [Pseudomonadota bacterium]